MIFRAIATAAVLSTALASAQTQQQAPTNIQPASDRGLATNASYTREQLLTSTVHQAWELSGKNEATFFDMVEQLAQISANNRGLTLPDSAAAGRRMGEYIKRTAKMDTDQLLYAVVDKAVIMATHAPAHPAGSSKATPKTVQ